MPAPPPPGPERRFGQDVEFLARHRRTLVLHAPDGPGRIAVVPELQGRVMTSSARGDAGLSHGFLHDENLASRTLRRGINVYGGEDRFWLGPEGGPFSFFFARGVEQTLEHWQTPALLDSEPWSETGLTGFRVGPPGADGGPGAEKSPERGARGPRIRERPPQVSPTSGLPDTPCPADQHRCQSVPGEASAGGPRGGAGSLLRFERPGALVNASGHAFRFRIEREIEVLSTSRALGALGIAPASPAVGRVAVVGFESRNRLVNTGDTPWTRASGMPSIWILGMFRAGPRTTAVLPLRIPLDADPSGLVNDTYFGRVPPERLQRVPAGPPASSALLFRADGRMRGKIGVAPAAALPVAGALDAARGVLTVVQFTLAPERPYVNSQWGLPQAEPFAGDAVNSYNDGPSGAEGESLGAFYELESSSPAAELAPSASLAHVHRTLHLEGPPEELARVCTALLGRAPPA